MQLKGVIEGIVYRNEENGYTVAKISSGRKLVPVVGKFAIIRIGENVELSGEYVENPKFGKQFAFDDYVVLAPTTVDGIVKYLSSGLLPGVGPVTAQNIADAFGVESLDIIEFTPEKLANIRGISEKKAEFIAENYAKVKNLQTMIMSLQKYDISINMALKIFNVYGEKTLKKFEENPYRLVEDVDGIGFQTADKIAMKMGIDRTSVFRIRAGFLHVLSEFGEKQGHTYLPKDMLLEEVATLLGLRYCDFVHEFNEALDDLVLDRVLVKNIIDEKPIIAWSKYFFSEQSVAKKLALLSIASNHEKRDITSEITNFENINHISFHDDQKDAISLAINNGVSVITGGPGTGKTTIVKAIINILTSLGQKVMLMAPTGRAAKRLSESTGIEAKTIHRSLEVVNGEGRMCFNYCENKPLDTNCVIVDEVSMVDAILMNHLLKALPRDAMLVLVGDKDQLPSVGAGNVLDDIITSNMIPVKMLTKIYRQDDRSLIVLNAHKINEGEMPILDNTSADFFFEKQTSPENILECLLSIATERLPNYLKTDATKIQILAPLKAGVCGISNLNKLLQEKLNPPSARKVEITIGFDTIFRVGDKVMQTQNNYEITWIKDNGVYIEEGEGVFNGDIGYIVSIDFQNSETKVMFEDGRLVCFSRDTLSGLSLAYAITVHKSQGCEFDAIIMPIVAGPNMIFTRNLFYTAITRAKKCVVLIGETRNISRLVRNNFTAKRFTMLKYLIEKSFVSAGEMYGE